MLAAESQDMVKTYHVYNWVDLRYGIEVFTSLLLCQHFQNHTYCDVFSLKYFQLL